MLKMTSALRPVPVPRSSVDDRDVREMQPINNNRNRPLINDAGRGYQFESQATQPFYNNQNTIVMVARCIGGYLMLMHETRIFFFEVEKLLLHSSVSLLVVLYEIIVHVPWWNVLLVRWCPQRRRRR